MRILAIADAVSPFVYSDNFPDNLPPLDLVLSAGDMPGHVLEFLATRLSVRPMYVLGNHADGYLRHHDDEYLLPTLSLPGGCLNIHSNVVEEAGLLIAGIEGSARYRPGPHQYSAFEMERLAAGLAPRLAWNRMRHGRALDILLTHAPPEGPHAGADRPHRGVAAFNRIHRWWRPKLHIHGHVHLNGANAAREYLSPEGVRVVNAYGFVLIEL